MQGLTTESAVFLVLVCHPLHREKIALLIHPSLQPFNLKKDEEINLRCSENVVQFMPRISLSLLKLGKRRYKP